ncbi:hypothetical protein, partial [Enterococcus faecium]|uniref:hypothetical protein n=2 Tax=Enterococcus faecium TaxID=1352 RepID=UPI001AD78C58
KTSKVEKEFYLRCSYLTLSVLFDKEPIFQPHLLITSKSLRYLLLNSFFMTSDKNGIQKLASTALSPNR